MDISKEKETEINRLKALCQSESNPVELGFDQSQLFEEKSKLELDLASKVKENTVLKKKNLKLGELLVQRDALILKQRKQLTQLTDRLQEYEAAQVNEHIVFHNRLNMMSFLDLSRLSKRNHCIILTNCNRFALPILQ